MIHKWYLLHKGTNSVDLEELVGPTFDVLRNLPRNVCLLITQCQHSYITHVDKYSVVIFL